MSDSSFTCHACGLPIQTGVTFQWWNVAPDAASGGTMKPFHIECGPHKTADRGTCETCRFADAGFCGIM